MPVQQSDPDCKGVSSTRLPPGYRFHPTDQELVSFYLVKKREKNNDVCGVVGEVDFNKCEPWDLPEKAKARDESSFYFYSCKDRKYPTGLRTNRATKAGYWKATGRDRKIVSKGVVGMKKTLVFYKGRAPKGEKTDWIMHEYRLDGELKAHQQDWVISRVFEKRSSSRKKVLSEYTPNSTCDTGYNLEHSSGHYQNRHHPSMILQASESQPSSSFVKPNYTNLDRDTLAEHPGYNLEQDSGQYQSRHHLSMILQAPESQPSSSFVKPNYTNLGRDTLAEHPGWFHEAPFPGFEAFGRI